MPDDLKAIAWEKFNAGWCPSDDNVGGRPNALLKMENLELNMNGALSLSGGCSPVGSTYGTNIHSLWSDDIDGSRIDYAAGANGYIYRGGSTLATGGDSYIMASGVAFKYSLLCSGAVRLKDTGTGSPVNLGIGAPTLAPNYVTAHQAKTAKLLITSDVKFGNAFSFYVGSDWEVEFISAGVETDAIQSNATSNGPIDMTTFLTVGGNITDNDIYQWLGPGVFTAGNVGCVDSITIDILLTAPSGSGAPVSDFYSQTWINPNPKNDASISFQPIFRRQNFVRVGTGTQTWSTVYGFRISCVFNSPCDLGFFPSAPFLGGDHSSLQGTYQYMQVFVNNTGSYIGRSIMSPVIQTGNLDMYYYTITSQDPSGIDPQVNEIWTYRRGGQLGQWYRINVLTSAFTTPWNDTLSDQDALDLDITFNTNLISTQSINKIYSIVGPIEGRWFFFTADICYPSDINDPDLVDVSLAIRVANTNSEVFLWAVKVSDGAILVGTSHDIYLLTGTFTTLPDGTIDVYYRSLGCKHPPICYDASYDSGLVYYLAADGWRTFSAFGQGNNLCIPNTDVLYKKGGTAYGYTGPAAVIPGSTRFPCLLFNQTLYCCITGQGRIEVYDLVRQYWRVITYGKGDATAIASTCTGIVTACFSSDNVQRDIDLKTTSLIDGSTKQAISALSLVFDDELPSNRKDLFDVKLRLLTGGGETLNIGIIDEFDNVTGVTATSSSVDTSELLKDDPVVSKNYQIQLTGSFSVFELSDIRLDYSPRPIPLTRYYVRPTNFGTPDQKLMAAWPIEIDTLGNTVTFTPKLDGSAVTSLNITTTANRKQTINYLMDSLVYATDFEALFTGGPFELYGLLPPVILDKLPIGLWVYQVGPIELFRYGKVKQIQWRAIVSGSPISYDIAVNNKIVYSSSLIVAAADQNNDTRFDIPVPKGIEGQSFKLRFYASGGIVKKNYYCRILVSKSGRDTDNEWIDLPVQQQGDQ